MNSSNPVFQNVLYHIFVFSFEIYEHGDPENLHMVCGADFAIVIYEHFVTAYG